ncbi:MAG: hypothetical protein [Circular genetic element sp.]|nr:MAG: hypothetical protein [Circular genetic element sp.]
MPKTHVALNVSTPLGEKIRILFMPSYGRQCPHRQRRSLIPVIVSSKESAKSKLPSSDVPFVRGIYVIPCDVIEKGWKQRDSVLLCLRASSWDRPSYGLAVCAKSLVAVCAT